jgi:type I restriction enzyme S subunit
MGIAQQDGIVSPAYFVFDFGMKDLQYAHALLRSQPYVALFAQASDGVRVGQWDLSIEGMKRIPIVVPPPAEQQAIVRYLDHIDRRVRRYIRAKQRLLALLHEQKQAIIHQAVTRGLDASAPLKPSGVAWLGEVPAHWEVVALRRVTTERCDGPFGSGLKSTHYVDNGVRVIRLQNIGHGEFRDDDAAYISEDHYATLGQHDVVAGDLLIAGLGDERHPAGRACVAPPGIEPAMVKADCFRFRLTSERLTPEFGALHLTATASDASSILSSGATRQRTNLSSTLGRAVLIPPKQEQEEIVSFLRRELSSIKSSASNLEREIDLIREYRTRLIADVVTGKVDVRAAAAALPTEEGEAEENFADAASNESLGEEMSEAEEE